MKKDLADLNDVLRLRLNDVLRLSGEKKVETMTETLKTKPDFNSVENMNAKPDPVELKSEPVLDPSSDQPEDEDVMDYFRKLADS